uniref:Uncharacterized protein n=1 Tax=Micrurus corallinus TaxID=54390 RepID=A0A2D4GYY3_MICCO
MTANISLGHTSLVTVQGKLEYIVRCVSVFKPVVIADNFMSWKEKYRWFSIKPSTDSSSFLYLFSYYSRPSQLSKFAKQNTEGELINYPFLRDLRYHRNVVSKTV